MAIMAKIKGSTVLVTGRASGIGRLMCREALERGAERVSTIALYYIDTGMFDGVRSRIIPILKPEPTAR